MRSGALSIPGTTATVVGPLPDAAPDAPVPGTGQPEGSTSADRTTGAIRKAETRIPAQASRMGPPLERRNSDVRGHNRSARWYLSSAKLADAGYPDSDIPSTFVDWHALEYAHWPNP